MVTITNVFLDVLRQSGLTPSDQLDAVLLELGPDLPPEPALLADHLIRRGLITSFQAEHLLRGRSRGFLIKEKYKIVDLIGSGGMGKVYLCEHLHLRHLVAVKVLPSEKTRDREAIERFYREARAAVLLNHPNIVRGHDIDSDGRIHFIVMEYVEGINLYHLVQQRGPLEVGRAVNYVSQAAAGLDHAWQRGMVHRDIKPSNLMVDHQGTVKILDLGLARLLFDHGEQITCDLKERSILGTADFLAPEQIVDSHSVDIRADIYSLGCTLYFLLAGQTPFAHANVHQKLVLHQSQEPRPIKELCPDLPDGLAEVISRMLAKDPSKRFAAPLDVVAALAPWMDPAPQALAISEMKPRPTTMGQIMAQNSTILSRSSSLTGKIALEPASGGKDIVSSDLSMHLTKAVEPGAAELRSTKIEKCKARRAGRWQWALLSSVILGGGCFSYWWLFVHQESWMKEPYTPPLRMPEGFETTTEKDTLYVARRIIPGGFVMEDAQGTEQSLAGKAYRTVHDALRHAEPGTRIVLVDQIHEEQLEIDGSTLPERIAIVSGVLGKAPSIWRLPRWVRNQPILRLHAAKSLTVRKLNFDGAGQADHLVVATGRCPGLRLQNLHLHGYREAGLVLEGCTGEIDDVIRIESCRVEPDGPIVPDCAIAVGNGKRADDTASSQHIVFRDCRLEGRANALVRVNGSLAFVEFKQNRFWNADAAFRFSSESSVLRFSANSNTFAATSIAFAFPSLPPAKSMDVENRILLRNNLFHRTRAVIQIEAAQDAARARSLFSSSEGNVCDADAGNDGSTNLSMDRLQFPVLSETTTDDNQFLRYPRSSPLAQAGREKQPVGAGPAKE